MEEKESKVISSARIRTFGAYKAIYDIELVDNSQKIYRGRPVVEVPGLLPATQATSKWVYFTRDYQPDVNDFDKIYVEIKIEDESLLGVPFSLVPKEKLLFGFDPAPREGILLPPPESLQQFRRQSR